MRRVSFISACLALCVFGLLGALTLADIADGPGSARQEREAPTPAPVTGLGDLPGFISNTRFYVGKRYALKEWFVTLNGRAKLVLFGHSPAPDVALGQAGYLFLTTAKNLDVAQGQTRMDAATRSLWEHHFTQLEQAFFDRNIPFLFVVGPNKLTIYPDKAPAWITPAERSETWTADVLAAAEAAGFDTLIDSREILHAARDVDPQTALYHPTDTHWTEWGAALVLEETFEASGLFPLEPPRFDIADMPRSGDLARMIGQQERWTAQAPVLPSDWSCTDAFGKPLPIVTIDPLTPREFTCGTPTGRPEKVVVFTDSFGISAIPFLAGRFKDVEFIWSDVSDPDRARAEGADLVIQILVERNLLSAEPNLFVGRL